MRRSGLQLSCDSADSSAQRGRNHTQMHRWLFSLCSSGFARTTTCRGVESRFQVSCIAAYLFCSWFTTNFVMVFVICVLLSAADFWYRMTGCASTAARRLQDYQECVGKGSSRSPLVELCRRGWREPMGVRKSSGACMPVLHSLHSHCRFCAGVRGSSH